MTVIPVNNKKKKTASASLDNNAAETQLFKVKTKQEIFNRSLNLRGFCGAVILLL